MDRIRDLQRKLYADDRDRKGVSWIAAIELDANWKFSKGDIEERKYWDDYMKAYEEALNATSRVFAPWYAVPADDRHFSRWSSPVTAA